MTDGEINRAAEWESLGEAATQLAAAMEALDTSVTELDAAFEVGAKTSHTADGDYPVHAEDTTASTAVSTAED